jgi:hypothetical protein
MIFLVDKVFDHDENTPKILVGDARRRSREALTETLEVDTSDMVEDAVVSSSSFSPKEISSSASQRDAFDRDAKDS